MKPYALFAVLTPLSMVGEVLGDLLQPKLMSKIVDDGVLGQDMDLIIRTGLLMLLVLIGGGACGIAASAFGGIASQSFSRDLRVDVFKRVMGLSFEQTDKFTTGSLVTRLTADITAIQQMVDFMLRMLVRDSLLFFGGIIMMLTLNVRFGIIILCALPVEIIMMIVILRKANPYYSIVAKRLDSVNSVVQENVTGARVVKAYVREDTEEKRFDDANISLMESNLRVQTLMAILQPLLMIILNLSVIAVIVIGGWQVQAQAMKVGEVMAAITYLTQVLHGVMMMSMMFQTLAKASASANRLREVLETDPVIKSGSVSLADKTGGTVSFKNVSFSYPETKGRPVISDLTLDIKSGESHTESQHGSRNHHCFVGSTGFFDKAIQYQPPQRNIQQSQSDYHQTHYSSRTESHFQTVVHAPAGRIRRSGRSISGCFHSDKTGQSGKKTTGQKGKPYPTVLQSRTISHPGKKQTQDQEYEPNNLILLSQISHRPFADMAGNPFHGLIAFRFLHHPFEGKPGK